jgi:hypothetical protein
MIFLSPKRIKLVSSSGACLSGHYRTYSHGKRSLFYGTLRQTISGNDSTRSKKSSHEKTDLFAHLPVQVSDEGHDLYDGLSGYFDDLVEFEGRQQRMEVTLVDLPPIIQIQLHVSGSFV